MTGSLLTIKDIDSLMKESEKMQRFRHPNVLNLIGVCIDAGEAPYIIMPYMANGSLLAYLRKKRPHLTIAEEAGEEMVNTMEPPKKGQFGTKSYRVCPFQRRRKHRGTGGKCPSKTLYMPIVSALTECLEQICLIPRFTREGAHPPPTLPPSLWPCSHVVCPQFPLPPQMKSPQLWMTKTY